MNKTPTIQEIKNIIEQAPSEANNVNLISLLKLKDFYKGNHLNRYIWDDDKKEWIPYGIDIRVEDFHNLDDLKTILKQDEKINQLEKEIDQLSELEDRVLDFVRKNPSMRDHFYDDDEDE